MKMHTMAVVELTEKQFETFAVPELEWDNGFALREVSNSGRPLFSSWEWEHGLTRTQKQVLAKFNKAVNAGATFVMFTRKSS